MFEQGTPPKALETRPALISIVSEPEEYQLLHEQSENGEAISHESEDIISSNNSPVKSSVGVSDRE